jgi:adenylate kinase family enzyme
MKRVLITGMSGTGKSSLLQELAARGYRTVDTDYGDYYETIDGERLWREERMMALLSAEPDDAAGVLFVQGTTRNQARFYPRFDHIVLLSAPADVLVERLTTRVTNPYGKDPAEIAETLEYQQTVEPLLRASATVEVVTTVPVAQVADLVLDHVQGPAAADPRQAGAAQQRRDQALPIPSSRNRQNGCPAGSNSTRTSSCG